MNTKADNQIRRFAAPDSILLATDLEDADHLLLHAIAQARASAAALTVAHVVPSAETIPLDASAISPADAAALKLEATRVLEKMASTARNAGVACKVVVGEGSPQRVIPGLVETGKVDRLILGTHGRRHLKKLLLGSVAQEILGEVDVPVCTIGPHVQPAYTHERPQKILHPVSLRVGYEQAARLAFEMAQFYQAEITLLHVLDGGLRRDYDSERVAQWTRSELQRLIPDEALLWTYVNSQIEVGGVVDHILSVANEMQADLIVLGTDAAGSFWPIRGDGTAYEVISRASCPVLTLRHSLAAEPQSEVRDVNSVFVGIF